MFAKGYKVLSDAKDCRVLPDLFLSLDHPGSLSINSTRQLSDVDLMPGLYQVLGECSHHSPQKSNEGNAVICFLPLIYPFNRRGKQSTERLKNLIWSQRQKIGNVEFEARTVFLFFLF